MATMGKYCKAYPLKQLREFPGWIERAEHARPDAQPEALPTGSPGQDTPRTLTDDDVLYVQENYVVTDGIFKDEHIIFDQVTPEWQRFCHDVLKFEIPVYASGTGSAQASAAEPTGG
jgi:hypothetical protein